MSLQFKNLCEVVGITTNEAQQNSLTIIELKEILKMRSIMKNNIS